jgi:uncharacterized protein (TIGR04255 family)
MDSKERDLPDFENPPLTEVAISVQFDSLPDLQTPQMGLLWSKFRDRFPKTEQHPPLDPIIEKFGPPSQPSIRLEISNAPPAPRCWFLNEAGSELIQIQADRFAHNWRKIKREDEYPRYAHVRKQFSEELVDFCRFLQNEGLGEFRPNQCEVSYINHIESGDVWNTHGQLGQILTAWNPQYSDDFLSEPESIRFATQHIFTNDNGDPIGRLHISIQPAFSVADNRPILVMNLTARGEPTEPTNEGVLSFVDKGREMIVRGFASITTPEMHKVWRRIR